MSSVFLCISIDTESDRSPDWSTSNPLGFRSVLNSIPELLHPLFMEEGAAPSYLLTSEVIENAECVTSLRGLPGRFELGTHLHADYVEPRRRHAEYAGTLCDDFQIDYPPEVEFAKLANLTESFRVAFGRAPRVFRAGRFAANAGTLASLGRLGYLVDTSVTPHMTWSNREGKVLSFEGAPEQPYFPSAEDIRVPGNGTVLEVPVTIARRFSWRASLRKLAPARRPSWLRPVFSSTRRMLALVDAMVRDAEHDGDARVLNMMFHSMELFPGASPYTRTERDVRAYLASLRSVLEHCRKRGVQFCTLEDLHPMFSGERG